MTQRAEKMGAKGKLKTGTASSSLLAIKPEVTIDFPKMIVAALRPMLDQMINLNDKFDTLQKELKGNTATTEKIVKKLIDPVLKAEKTLKQQQKATEASEKVEGNKDAEDEEDKDWESSDIISKSVAELLGFEAELGAVAPKPIKTKRLFDKTKLRRKK